MRPKYGVSLNGLSYFYDTKERAILAAVKAEEHDPEMRIVVHNEFNNVIWEN